VENIRRNAGCHLITACGHFAAAAAETAGFRVLRRQKYMSAYLQQLRKLCRGRREGTPERGVGGWGGGGHWRESAVLWTAKRELDEMEGTGLR
jgi:hypothetical protein